MLDEAVRSVEIASEISICIFKYKVRCGAALRLHATCMHQLCALLPTHARAAAACAQDSTAEQLGVLAQQTREVLERYGAAHLNIVKEDGQVSMWRLG